MNHKNCMNCKNARSDITVFSGERYHCKIYNDIDVPWYYNQHIMGIQLDLLKSVGCASFEESL